MFRAAIRTAAVAGALVVGLPAASASAEPWYLPEATGMCETRYRVPGRGNWTRTSLKINVLGANCRIATPDGVTKNVITCESRFMVDGQDYWRRYDVNYDQTIEECRVR